MFQIPPHGRWQHFDIPGSPQRIAPLRSAITLLHTDTKNRTKALIDLFLVSVLLDAGAGATWKYKEEGSNLSYSRSEGLAIASLDMFKKGMFSSRGDDPFRVDGEYFIHNMI